MTLLTRPNSPLDQVRHEQCVNIAPSRRPIGLQDQAVLRQILADSKYAFVQNKLFDQPEATAIKAIFDDAPTIRKPDTSWYHPAMDGLSGIRGQKHVGSVLLTTKEEQALFIQFNYCRYRTCKLVQKISEKTQIDSSEARELLGWYRKAEKYRDQIASTNLALVLAMAKRTRISEVDFPDLVSEGNMALLRAIDKFDVARGFKFSTYACRAILKAFSRSGVKMSKYRQLFPTDFDPVLEKSNHMELKRIKEEDDCVDDLKRVIRDNGADLSKIEQEVIEHRFAVGSIAQVQDKLAPNPLTLEQVGKIIGLTKERVRQIQNKALEKIRVTLEDEYL